MGFIAEIRLSHPNLVLIPTIERHPDITLRREYKTTIDRDTRLFFFSALGDDFQKLQSLIDDDPTVTGLKIIAVFANRHVYRVRVTTELQLIPSLCARRGVFVFKVTSGNGAWLARILVPTRDTLHSFREYCLDNDIEFQVNQLYDSDSTDQNKTAGMTEQQKDLLLTAFYSGYYDVPRRVSQSDLADQLNVSTSAISQRLRRAISQLILSSFNTCDDTK